jgi:hypothetical protein
MLVATEIFGSIPMWCILLRGVHVNGVNDICFYLYSQLLYFIDILFSQHVSASVGHRQVSTYTVTGVKILA